MNYTVTTSPLKNGKEKIVFRVTMETGKTAIVNKSVLEFLLKYENQPERLCTDFGFVPVTKADKQRLNVAMSYVNNVFKGDGVVGAVLEMLTARENSRKAALSTPGKSDNYTLTLRESGKVTTVTVERKHNSANLTADEFRCKGGFVVYNYVNFSYRSNNKPVGPINTEMKVFRKEFFYSFLAAHKGIKLKKQPDGSMKIVGVQGSSKALQELVEFWPFVYDRETVIDMAALIAEEENW